MHAPLLRWSVISDRYVTVWFAVGLFFALVGLAFVSGCAGFGVLEMQRSLTTAASITEDLDSAIAPLVESAVTRCDAEHADREGFLECIQPYVPLHWGIVGLRSTLTAGQASLDAVRAGQRDSAAAWLPIGACIVHALGMIVHVVRLADLDVALADALGWIGTAGDLAASICPEGETP